MLVYSLMPGLIVAGTISLAATFLSDHYGGPVMLFALLLGMAFNFVSQNDRCLPGIDFASRTILRCGVALLGFRITAEEVFQLGVTPLVVVVMGIAVTLLTGLALAQRLGLSRSVGILTGGSVAICGASAALAIAAILPKGVRGISEHDAVVTIVGVTTLSTIAMVVYPIISVAVGLGEADAGIFVGATIHDVAQVVGAGYSLSPTTGDIATLTKMLRIAMLAPLAVMISVVVRSWHPVGSVRRPLVPWFLVAFLTFVTANSFGLVPAGVGKALVTASQWALVAAIAALGTKTSLKDLTRVNPRMLLLIGLETIVIAAIVLIPIFLMR